MPRGHYMEFHGVSLGFRADSMRFCCEIRNKITAEDVCFMVITWIISHVTLCILYGIPWCLHEKFHMFCPVEFQGV